MERKQSRGKVDEEKEAQEEEKEGVTEKLYKKKSLGGGERGRIEELAKDRLKE